MKGTNYVLLGISLILFAGVITYNVVSIDNDLEVTTNTSTSTTKSESTSQIEETTITNSKININKASEEELETLKGIGPSKAKAIVEYRENNGDFSSVEELTNVSGIGEKTLANIIDDITVD